MDELTLQTCSACGDDVWWDSSPNPIHNECHRVRLTAENAELREKLASLTGRVRARTQPCGCVVCHCDSESRCSGCGAKNCGTDDCVFRDPLGRRVVYETEPSYEQLREQLSASEARRAAMVVILGKLLAVTRSLPPGDTYNEIRHDAELEAEYALSSPDLAPWVALLKEIPLTMRGHSEQLGGPCHCLLCDAARECGLGRE